MWSLPDLARLNSQAASNKKSLERAVRSGRLDGKFLTCEYAGHRGSDCHGRLHHYLWFDIFSDDPKGIITLCDHHDGYSGDPLEGYFTCAICERVVIENYTWDYYRTDVGGDIVCLPCAAKRYIAESGNWIALTPEAVAEVDFDRVRQAGHVIGVEMPVPASIEFKGHVELDSSTGGRLTGFSSCERTPDGGVAEIQQRLTELREEGYSRVLLIVDGAYQFSVSIGVYVDALRPISKSARKSAGRGRRLVA